MIMDHLILVMLWSVPKCFLLLFFKICPTMLIGGIISHIKLEHEQYRGLLKCDQEVGSGWINVKYFPRAVSHCYAMDVGIIVP